MKLYQGLMAATAGRLKMINEPAYQRFAHSLEDGTEWEVTIRPKSRRQGSQTLRYLRGVVIPDIALACGYTDPDDYQSVYEGLMWKLFRLPDGAFHEPRRRSFAKDVCSQEQATEMVTTIIDHAETTIVGCKVRRPNEVDLDNTPMVWVPKSEGEGA